MKRTHTFRLVLLLSGLIVASPLLTACDVMRDTADLTEEEAVLVSGIVADAIAGQTEGLVADIYDVTADLGAGGLHYQQRHGHHGPSPEMRGFQAVYNPETGVHTIAYERSFTGPLVSRSMSALLEYIYRDAEGNPLEFPMRARRANMIADIEFAGTRSGVTEGRTLDGTGSRRNAFSRETEWQLSGLAANRSHMSLSGRQRQTGDYEANRGDSFSQRRSFTLDMQFVDVVIERALSTEGNLEQRISGTVQYTVKIEHELNGQTTTREAEGTLEIADSKALMRLMGMRRAFLIDLNTGATQAR
jgi:hypothetical protein